MKTLTGSGKFSTRGHHEGDTEKELNLTMIMECNKKPLFQEEPKHSEIRRIIDLLFRSTFTDNKYLVDEEKNIFESNLMYSDQCFQEEHKYALLHILFEEHKKYLQNDSKFIIPQSVTERTNFYLELSCHIFTWFKSNYVMSNNKTDFLQIKYIYDHFKCSDYYYNLRREDKRTYNKSFFVEYFKTNIFLKNYYFERNGNLRNVLNEWKIKEDEKNEQDHTKDYNLIIDYIQKNIIRNEEWKTKKDDKFISILKILKNDQEIKKFLIYYSDFNFESGRYKDEIYLKIKELSKYCFEKTL